MIDRVRLKHFLILLLLIGTFLPPSSSFQPNHGEFGSIPRRISHGTSRSSLANAQPHPKHISSSRDSNTRLQAFGVADELTQFALAGTLGVVTDPLAELAFQKNPQWNSDGDIKTTFLHGAADSISNAARLYASLVLIGVTADWLDWTLVPSTLAASAAPIALTVWAGLTLGTVKRSVFLQLVAGNKLGRVRLYDQLIDFVLWLLVGANVLNELDMDIGMGFQSFFAASGVGALIFSLANKDLAEQIVGGIILQAWDAFDVDDDVRLGDGTEGAIKKIGLVETEIVGYDNISIKIPNSSFTSQRISNISRTQQSRVQETLRFAYPDIDRLPELLQDIKDEIKASCPDLITDGSKPFTAMLDSYQEDHIKVMVNCHFNLQPFGADYFAAKEAMLLAIARAASNNNVKFAIPAIKYINR